MIPAFQSNILYIVGKRTAREFIGDDKDSEKYNDKDKYTDKDKYKDKYKDKVKVHKILNMCYIFEKQRVQGYQIRHF